MDRQRTSPFFRLFAQRVADLGGMFNAHLHLDRACTLGDEYLVEAGIQVLENSHVSLKRKHALINAIHQGPAYRREDLERRVDESIDVMAAVGTRRADTLVDVTADGIGTSALEALMAVKQRRADDIDLRVAAYSPLGFVDAEPERWETYLRGADGADFLACLPEADDTDDYPDHIGFMEHCRRFLELAQDQGKMLHVHTDQRNEPSESGTERLIEAVRRYGAPRGEGGEPGVWAIHVVSPSTYDEDRFKRLVDGLLECNIGIISCPSAAIGMRQLRPLKTPTGNCIPRILELLAAGVRVRLGCDNVADICSPSTTADLTDEVFVLSAAIRYYQIDVLARIAAGQALDGSERSAVIEHLRKNDEEIEKVLRATGQSVAR